MTEEEAHAQLLAHDDARSEFTGRSSSDKQEEEARAFGTGVEPAALTLEVKHRYAKEALYHTTEPVLERRVANGAIFMGEQARRYASLT